MDIIIVAITTAIQMWYFGWENANMENLLAVMCLILVVAFNGVLLLSNFWSVAANEFFAYKHLDGSKIIDCTHVKCKVNNKKQNIVKRYIVPLIRKNVEISEGKVSKAIQVEI